MDTRQKILSRLSHFTPSRNAFSRQGIKSKIGKWIFENNVKIQFDSSKEDLVVVVDGYGNNKNARCKSSVSRPAKDLVSQPFNVIRLPAIVDFLDDERKPIQRPRSLSLPQNLSCTLVFVNYY